MPEKPVTTTKREIAKTLGVSAGRVNCLVDSMQAMVLMQTERRERKHLYDQFQPSEFEWKIDYLRLTIGQLQRKVERYESGSQVRALNERIEILTDACDEAKRINQQLVQRLAERGLQA